MRSHKGFTVITSSAYNWLIIFFSSTINYINTTTYTVVAIIIIIIYIKYIDHKQSFFLIGYPKDFLPISNSPKTCKRPLNLHQNVQKATRPAVQSEVYRQTVGKELQEGFKK